MVEGVSSTISLIWSGPIEPNSKSSPPGHTTHAEQWAARGAVGSSVPCSRGTSVMVLRVEESAVHSLPPPTIPARPETL